MDPDDAPDNLTLARIALETAKEARGLTPEVIAMENILHYLERLALASDLGLMNVSTQVRACPGSGRPRPGTDATNCTHRWEALIGYQKGIELRCQDCWTTTLIGWTQIPLL